MLLERAKPYSEVMPRLRTKEPKLRGRPRCIPRSGLVEIPVPLGEGGHCQTP